MSRAPRRGALSRISPRPAGRWLRRLLAAAGLLAGAGLTGCAHRPDLPAGALRHEGRLSVQVAGDAQRSFSAGFELSGSAAAGRLVLTTPLGSRAAQADWSPGEVRLRSSDGERSYPDLDSLSREALGEVLPLAALFDWLQGRPWPQAPSLGGPGGFEQLGWTVDLSRFSEGWVQARRGAAPEVNLRIRLDDPAAARAAGSPASGRAP